MKLAALVAILAASPVALGHLRWNASPSMPIGLFWRSGDVQRGAIVEVCAPEPIVALGLARGYLYGFLGPCYRGSFPLVKVLAGAGGDVVDVSPAGVAVNGRLWPSSQRRFVDRSGARILQWMPYGRLRLARDRVLVLGQHPESWDSRSWGPIPSASVRARWSPILTLPMKES